MIDFFTGLLLGIISVGLTTYRMIEILDSHPARVFIVSLGISAAYFFSIRFIAEQNIIGYIGFSLGSAVITTILAKYRSKL